ncbi:MAG: hypothetical protein V5B36_11270 [Candidatus Accumulibacter sp. UW25]
MKRRSEKAGALINGPRAAARAARLPHGQATPWQQILPQLMAWPALAITPLASLAR